MRLRIWQVLQLVAIAPVAFMSLMGAFIGLMALTSIVSTGAVLASLAIAGALVAPAVMVLSLGVAIVIPPERLRADDRLTGLVALGLVSGCILAVWLICMEMNEPDPASWRALLAFAAPLVLAIVHAVKLARARPVPAGPRVLPPGAVE